VLLNWVFPESWEIPMENRWKSHGLWEIPCEIMDATQEYLTKKALPSGGMAWDDQQSLLLLLPPVSRRCRTA
jgi:hypothetical protein